MKRPSSGSKAKTTVQEAKQPPVPPFKPFQKRRARSLAKELGPNPAMKPGDMDSVTHMKEWYRKIAAEKTDAVSSRVAELGSIQITKAGSAKSRSPEFLIEIGTFICVWCRAGNDEKEGSDIVLVWIALTLAGRPIRWVNGGGYVRLELTKSEAQQIRRFIRDNFNEIQEVFDRAYYMLDGEAN